MEVDKRAEIRVDIASVINGRAADSADTRLGSWRTLRGINVLVTRGDTYKDTSLGQLCDSIIDGLVLVGSQTEVGQNTLGAITLVLVSDEEVNALKHIGVGTRAAVTKDLDSIDETLLGNTVGL